MAERTGKEPGLTVERGDLEELRRLIGGFDIAMLTTRGTDGHFHSRPMALQKQHQKREQLLDHLWFATWADSQKVIDLKQDPHCSLSFYDQKSYSYVSLSGEAEVVNDRAKIHELWEPGWRVWFPNGADEPALRLIRFHPEHAEYVHLQTGRLQVLFSVVRALVTKTRAEPTSKKEMELPH